MCVYIHKPLLCTLCVAQELQPKGRDVLKEEMGDMVDKEMVATSTAIEEAVLRMDVRTPEHTLTHTGSVPFLSP